MEEINLEGSNDKKEGKKDKNMTLKKKYIYFSVVAIVLITAAVFLIGKYNPGCKGNACDASISGEVIKDIDASDIVAEIDGVKITDEEFNKDIDLLFFLQGVPESYRSSISKTLLLNQTIIQDLIMDEALKQGYKLDGEKAKKDLEDSLERSGMSLSDFKEKIENKSFDYAYLIAFYAKQELLNRFINDSVLSKVSLGKNDALDYYNENKDQFKVEEQIGASHILLNTSEEAEMIIKKLDDGEDFGTLAKDNSIGPSAPKEGDLGYFSRGMMVPEFEDAAFALEEVGDYTKEPVKTQFGYHVIKLTGKKEAGQMEFDEVKDQIEKTLLQQKQSEALKGYVDDLFQDADIRIYLKEETETTVQPKTELQKSDTPKVELFVMSYCPYGTQIEKGMIPVIDLLDDKVDFSIKFVNYAMHGKKEIDENTRQYCIQKEQDDKFIKYLSCFLKDGDSGRCLKETEIDKEKLDGCVAEADKEFEITSNLENKQGQFPKYLVHDGENKKYGVRGSPTLVINGKTMNSGRDSASLLKTICSTFNDQPDECNEDISSEQQSPGFGYNTQTDSASGGCGA